MVDHIKQQLLDLGQKPPATPSKASGKGKTSPRTLASRPAQLSGPGAYGIVHYTHYTGVRFVAHDIPEAVAQELAAVCARHGVRLCSTTHFLRESGAH